MKLYEKVAFVRIDPKTYLQVEKYGKKRNISISEVFRQAVRLFIKRK